MISKTKREKKDDKENTNKREETQVKQTKSKYLLHLYIKEKKMKGNSD